MANGCSFPYLTTALVVAALLSGIRAWQNQCGHSPQMVSARTYIAGVIESPNYQNQYPNNTNCQWKIVARQGYIVRLYVVDMDLEEDSHCSYDSVSIFDGGSKMKHSRLAKICGQNYQYHNFYSTGRYMYIDFTSDGSITKRGFQLRYKAIVSSRSNYSSSSTTTTTTTTTPRSSGGQCHSSMTYPLHASPGVTRSIYSPNYPNEYPRNLNCGWKIVASWGYVVRLYVAHVDFEECDNCTFDSVSVFDGGRFYSTRQHTTRTLASRGVVGVRGNWQWQG